MKLIFSLKLSPKLEETFIFRLLVTGALNAFDYSLNIAKARALQLTFKLFFLFYESKSLLLHLLSLFTQLTLLAAQLDRLFLDFCIFLVTLRLNLRDSPHSEHEILVVEKRIVVQIVSLIGNVL